MRDGTLLMTGVVGAVVMAVCCVLPLLTVVFGAIGLTAWLANADYVVIPTLILCLGLIGFSLYRKQLRER
jgi:mercuric ion transport protein